MQSEGSTSIKAGTGIDGLDDVLDGGFEREAVFLIEGNPGTGKTTLALQFLLAGAAAARPASISPCRRPSRSCARGRVPRLDARRRYQDLRARAAGNPARPRAATEPALFLRPRTGRDDDADSRRSTGPAPSRIVLDSLSEIRLLAQSSLRYRRQMLAMKHYFARNNATVLMLDDLTAEAMDKTVHSVAHGVIRLEELAPNYGAERRRMRVIKYRGRPSAAATTISPSRPAGSAVFPRLVAAEHRTGASRGRRGPAASRRSTAARRRARAGLECPGPRPRRCRQVAVGAAVRPAAIERGERAALFIFDEELGLLFARAPKPWASIIAGAACDAASCMSSRSTPPNCRPANSPISCATSSRRTTSRRW